MSVLNQTYSELEIILINDGSTDGSLLIAQRYADQDKRIILVSQQNCGLSAARNAGLSIASGSYVAFIDSDDWVEPQMFAELYKIASNEILDFICFRLQFDNYQLGTQVIYGHDYNIDILEDTAAILKDALLVKNIPTAACAKLYSRDFLCKYGILFEKGIVNEDTLFTIQISCFAKRIAFVNQVLYHAVEREGSISRSSQERLFVDMHTALMHAKNTMITVGLFEKLAVYYESRYIKSMLYNLLQAAQRLPLKKYVDVFGICSQKTFYLQYYSSTSILPLKHRLMYRLSLHRYCFFYLLRVANLLGFRMH